MMKAIVQRQYGTPDVLDLVDIPRPQIGDDEVLVSVLAASVGPWVWRMIGPNPLIMRVLGGGLRRPKRSVLGEDMAGVVEEVGRNVTLFKVGDEVYGDCAGCYAEFAKAPEDRLAPKPRNLTFEQAAAVPIAAHTALLGLVDHGRVQPGQRVLIIGASGGVGTFAVQIAKWLKAEVTGVCSTGSVDLVRSLGADHVIDYTKEDFMENGKEYDMILELAGTKSALRMRGSLTPKGVLVVTSGEGGRLIGPIARIAVAVVASPFVSQTFRTFYASSNRENLITITGLIESGEISPVIDKSYPLSETADAIRYAAAGHTRGKTVITI